MHEVQGKRVGVRWDPPALIYVYQLGQVLRMARIPVRNLEDENIVEQIYSKHKDSLLRGLERHYVQRMVSILKHHHGIESQHDNQTEDPASERLSEPECEATDSEIQSIDPLSFTNEEKKDLNENKSKTKNNDNVDLKNDNLHISNKLINIQSSKNKLTNRGTRGSDLLLLLNQASKSNEENEITVINNNGETIPSKKEEKNKKQEHTSSNKLKTLKNNQNITQEKNKTEEEILELISQDLSKVQKDKRNLASLVKRNDLDAINREHFRTSNSDDKKKEQPIVSKNSEVKITGEDNSEDTDLDLDDIDIPLDPVQSKNTNLDILDDDFWS